MNLQQLLSRLRELPEDECIFARKPWSPSAEAMTSELGEDFKVPEGVSALGFEYFLEVHVAREVLEVFGNRTPTKEEELKLLLFYAEHDAYPDWVYSP